MVPEIPAGQRLRHPAMFWQGAQNTPEMEISPAGPVQTPLGPTGQGFDYFYGFNQGETSPVVPNTFIANNRGRSSNPSPPSRAITFNRRHDR